MDGIHDLGGMHGFGTVVTEPDEPPFHEPWEGRVHGIMLAVAVSGGLRGNFRYAIERMPAHEYLTTSYYEHWLHACETLLVEAGVVTRDELAAPRPMSERRDPESAARVRALMVAPRPPRDAGGAQARFSPGDRVRVTPRSVPGHTRCPRYVRGVSGSVERVLRPAMLPDGPPRLEPVYTVVFDSADVFGEGTEQFRVSVDLWESYLERAPR